MSAEEIKVVREIPGEVKNAFGVISDYLMSIDLKKKLSEELVSLKLEFEALNNRRIEVKEKIGEIEEKIDASDKAADLIKDLMDLAEEA